MWEEVVGKEEDVEKDRTRNKDKKRKRKANMEKTVLSLHESHFTYTQRWPGLY